MRAAANAHAGNRKNRPDLLFFTAFMREFSRV
jgi:hypothetical protein